MKSEDIKFKGKALNSGEWVVGDLLHRITDTCIVVRDMDDIVYYPVNPATICQFTGLKDKNGTAIYENDILKYNDGKILFTKPVEYRKGAFRIGCNLLYILQDSESFIKIIGNKFDK